MFSSPCELECLSYPKEYSRVNYLTIPTALELLRGEVFRRTVELLSYLKWTLSLLLPLVLSIPLNFSGDYS